MMRSLPLALAALAAVSTSLQAQDASGCGAAPKAQAAKVCEASKPTNAVAARFAGLTEHVRALPEARRAELEDALREGTTHCPMARSSMVYLSTLRTALEEVKAQGHPELGPRLGAVREALAAHFALLGELGWGKAAACAEAKTAAACGEAKAAACGEAKAAGRRDLSGKAVLASLPAALEKACAETRAKAASAASVLHREGLMPAFMAALRFYASELDAVAADCATVSEACDGASTIKDVAAFGNGLMAAFTGGTAGTKSGCGEKAEKKAACGTTGVGL